MVSLKDALKSIKNPKPVDFDPEDFERKNPGSDESDDEDVTEYEKKLKAEEKALARAHYVNVEKSDLRKKNDEGLKVDGKKYTGAKVSRKDLYQNNSDSEEDDEEEEEDEDEDDEEEQADGDESEGDSDQDILDVDSDDEEQESEDEEDEETLKNASKLNDSKRNQLKELLKNEQQKLVSQISKAAKDEAQKGEGIKSQIKIYEAILDSRIKIQKGLAAANSLPLTQRAAKKHSTEETPELTKQVAKTLFGLLDRISIIRKNLMIKDSLISEESNEGESEDDDDDKKSHTVEITTGKRDLETAFGNEKVLSKRLKPYRETVLTKWSKKVQAASGISALNASKFSIQNTNAQTQVASHLADMDRLIKRTQINRGEAKILGEDEKEDPASEEEQDEEEMDEKTRIKKRIEKQKQQKKLKQQQILQQKKQKKTEGEEMDQLADPDSNLKEYVEIYDDMDFYKALLKDLVDRRMADTNVASSVKWTITKNNNGKDKNNEDKFSKDRRLNFKIQEKLQNFDAPRNTVQWTEDQIDELFSGLFGQKIAFSDDEEDEQNSEEEEGEDDYIVNDGLKIFG